jgi:hypothetical protein
MCKAVTNAFEKYTYDILALVSTQTYTKSLLCIPENNVQKSKTIPVTGVGGPWGYDKSKIPIFRQPAHR